MWWFHDFLKVSNGDRTAASTSGHTTFEKISWKGAKKCCMTSGNSAICKVQNEPNNTWSLFKKKSWARVIIRQRPSQMILSNYLAMYVFPALLSYEWGNLERENLNWYLNFPTRSEDTALKARRFRPMIIGNHWFSQNWKLISMVIYGFLFWFKSIHSINLKSTAKSQKILWESSKC